MYRIKAWINDQSHARKDALCNCSQQQQVALLHSGTECVSYILKGLEKFCWGDSKSNLTRESLDYLSRPLSDSGSDNQPTSWVFLDGRNPQLFSINWPLVLIHFSFTTYYGQRWRAEKWPFIGGRRVMGINRNGDERKHFPVIFIFLWPKSLLFPLRGGWRDLCARHQQLDRTETPALAPAVFPISIKSHSIRNRKQSCNNPRPPPPPRLCFLPIFMSIHNSENYFYYYDIPPAARVYCDCIECENGYFYLTGK